MERCTWCNVKIYKKKKIIKFHIKIEWFIVTNQFLFIHSILKRRSVQITFIGFQTDILRSNVFKWKIFLKCVFTLNVMLFTLLHHSIITNFFNAITMHSNREDSRLPHEYNKKIGFPFLWTKYSKETHSQIFSCRTKFIAKFTGRTIPAILCAAWNFNLKSSFIERVYRIE